ncbi:MAG TPA: DUF805 domain-containing protein [Prevotella sp.]
MEKLIAKPQLGFAEAVKLASGRLLDFNGRSRRSEFWWFMLAFILCNMIFSQIVTLILPNVAGALLQEAFMFLTFAVTVRRLQDGGHSMWWVIVSWIASTVYSVSMYTSGIMEAATSINPNPADLTGMFSNPVLIVSSIIAAISGITVLVFCCMDGKAEPNRYGDSPKYVVVNDEENDPVS